MKKVFSHHWPEYLIEAWALGMFMISACLFTILLEFPAFPLRLAVPSGLLRRGVVGLAMGLTAIVLIYSPWGKRSGAHMNPAVTLSFWRLGRIAARDAVFYVLFQFLGGVTGVALTAALAWPSLAHPNVSFIVTQPGPAGAGIAWLAEFAISFLLMATVLITGANPSWMGRTGLYAGLLIFLYVALEAPLSGMSMNPARTFASAFVARSWSALWVYFTAPPLGMLAAAELFRFSGARAMCAKLAHDSRIPCIFCGDREVAS